MKKVYIETVAEYCDEARLETQRLTNLLQSREGFELDLTNKIEDADLIIFYTCGHLSGRERDSINAIKKINRRRKPTSELIVHGCLPKINPFSLKDICSGNTYLSGPEETEIIAGMLSLENNEFGDVRANCIKEIDRSLETFDLIDKLYNVRRAVFLGLLDRSSSVFNPEKTWYIKIIHGCKHHCTYCSDLLAYKTLKSEPIHTILEQFELGLHKGYRRFYLVGRDLGSYGYDIDLDLSVLLNDIYKKHPNEDYRFYLHNVSPSSLIDIYPKLEQNVLSGKIMEIGSHIQSGSKRILKLMGKDLCLPDWLKTISNIKKKYPPILLSTSIMVGFPGETNFDFTKSSRLLKKVSFDIVEVFKYNERPGLPSLKLKDRIDEGEKKIRYDKMRYHAGLCQIRRRIERGRALSFPTFDLALETIYHRVMSSLVDPRKTSTKEFSKS